MQPSPLQTPAESFAGMWSALHRSGDFTVSDAEVHYLTATALAVDDELTSHLLLKKLKLASTVTLPLLTNRFTCSDNTLCSSAATGQDLPS